MDSEVIAPYLIRQYIWEVIKMNLGASTDDYNGDVPIVPLAEEPEMTEFTKPYIVYGYAEAPSYDLPGCHRGNMVFVVYSQNFRTLSNWVNVITQTLSREDESARDVNTFTGTKPAFVGLRFSYIGISFVEGGSPEATEGGRQSASVNVRYEYTADYNIQTRPVASTWPVIDA